MNAGYLAEYTATLSNGPPRLSGSVASYPNTAGDVVDYREMHDDLVSSSPAAKTLSGCSNSEPYAIHSLRNPAVDMFSVWPPAYGNSARNFEPRNNGHTLLVFGPNNTFEQPANTAQLGTTDSSVAPGEVGRNTDSSGQAKYATKEQWQAHRSIIQDLYRTNKLKEVMSTMEREHNFFATTKMYKTYFKRWKLDNKHIKSTDALQIARRKYQRDCVQKASKIFLRGRVVDWEHIENHIKRDRYCQDRLASGDFTTSDISDIIVRTPTPDTVPLVLYSNDNLAIAEELGKILSDYVTGVFEAGMWYVQEGRVQGRKIYRGSFEEWANLGLAAVSLINLNQNYSGFLMLNQWLDKIGDLMRIQHPRMLFETINVVLYLPNKNDVSSRVQLHLASISKIIFGPSHPLTIFWTRLGCRSRLESLQVVVLAVPPMLDLLERRVGSGSQLSCRQRWDHLHWQVEVGHLERISCLFHQIQTLLLQIEDETTLRFQLHFLVIWGLAIRSQHAEAEKLLDTVQSTKIFAHYHDYSPSADWISRQVKRYYCL